MAQAVLTVAGGYFFGPVGAAAGSALGAYLDATVFFPQKFEGARLEDLKVPRFEYGAPIPRLWGQCRFPGIPLWMSDKREISTTSGGKGAEPEVTNYTYEVDLLLLLVDVPIDAVARIWKNGELVYSAHVDSDEETFGASASTDLWGALRVYTGDPAQLPDPVYEAAVGIGNAPSYRHRGTVFIESLQLGPSGQIPVLTFEVLTEASTETVCVETEPRDDCPLRLALDEGGGIATEIGIYTVLWSTFVEGLYPSYQQQPPGTQRHVVETSRGVEGCYRYFEANIIDARSGGTSSALIPEMLLIRVGTYAGGGAVAGIDRQGDCTDADGAIIDEFALPSGAPPGSKPRLAYLNSNYTLGIAFNTENGQLWAFDGTYWYGATPTAHPSNLTDGIVTGIPGGSSDLRLEFIEQGGSFNIQVTIRTRRDAFIYDVPDGYVPWSSDSGDIDVVTPGTWYLADVVSDLCVASGLSEDDIDVTELEGIEIDGVPITQVSTARSILENLSAIYFFECTESDKLYFRLRGGPSRATIAYEDLAVPRDTDAQDPLGVARAGDDQVPAYVTIQYVNVSDDYQAGTVQSDRLVGDSESTRSFAAPVVLEPSKAKGVADAAVLDAKVASLSFRPALNNLLPQLEPTDVITLVDIDDTTYRARIGRETFADGVRQLECVLDDASVLVSAGITDESSESSLTVRKATQTLWELLDIPILRDDDDAPGIYVVVKPLDADSKWPGSVVYRSADDTNFTAAGTLTRAGIFGLTTTTLGDVASCGVFDEVSTVTVDVVDGELSSTTRDLMLTSDVNAALVGSEIIQFRTATFVSAGVYTLSGLLRGRRGTEWATGTHEGQERFVLLQEPGMLRAATDLAWIGEARFWKAVTQTRSLAAVDSEEFTDTGIALKPFAPVDLRLEQTAGGYVLSWLRRTRYRTQFTGTLGSVVPLGEESEAYDVDFISPSDEVISTQRVTEPQASLSIAAANGTLPAPTLKTTLISGSYFGVEYGGNTNLTLRQLTKQTTSGVLQRSPYLGARLVDAVYTATDAYTAAYYVTGGVPAGYGDTFVQRFALADISAAAATYTAGTAGDVAGIAHDGTDVWIVERISLRLRKLDASTLSVLASHAFSGPMDNGLAHASGDLFFIDGGDLVSWDIGTSGENWRTALPAGHTTSFGVTAHAGNVFVTSYPLGVLVYAQADGSLVEDTGITHYPQSDAGGVIPFGMEVAIWDGAMVYVLDGATGAVLGSFEATGAAGGSDGTNIVVLGTSALGVVGYDLARLYQPLAGSLDGYGARVYQISATVGRGYPASITF